MIKCPKCGNVFPDSSRFCGICGTPLYGPAPALFVEKVEEKETFLAILFSFILAGLGQIYCGKIVRGILILVISLVPMIAIWVIIGTGDMMTGKDLSSTIGPIVLLLILYLAFWVWQIFDAYKLSLKWNEAVESNYVKPW